MWATVSVLQMMSYVTLIELNFPENLLSFLGCIESVHDFNRWLPNPFTFLFPAQKLNMTSYNDQFESRGFANRNMLYLCGSDLIMMAVTGLVILILIPLSNFARIFGTLLEKLRYSSITRSFIQSYLKICLAAYVNVGIYSFNNPATAVSSLISIIVSCLLVGIPAFISEFLYRYRDLAAEDKKFRTSHASYVTGFRVKANILNLMFYPIFMFRRLAFAGTIVLLSGLPELQLAFLNIGTLAFAGYMYYWKPFKNKYSLYAALSAELFFLIFTSILYYFTVPRPDSKSSIVGWMMISTVVLSLGTSWVCVVAQQIRAWKWRKQLKEKKEKAAKEHETEMQNVEKEEQVDKVVEQEKPINTEQKKEINKTRRNKLRSTTSRNEAINLNDIKARLEKMMPRKMNKK